MATNSDTAYISKAVRLLRALRLGIADDISIQLAHTFMIVAENEGKTVNELGELVGSSRTTISRHLLDLSERLRNGEAGYKLVNRIQHPTDLRSVIFTVSPRGRQVLNSVKDAMED